MICNEFQRDPKIVFENMVETAFPKNLFFLLKFFLCILNFFWYIDIKKNIYYINIFLNKKYLKLQPLIEYATIDIGQVTVFVDVLALREHDQEDSIHRHRLRK